MTECHVGTNVTRPSYQILRRATPFDIVVCTSPSVRQARRRDELDCCRKRGGTDRERPESRLTGKRLTGRAPSDYLLRRGDDLRAGRGDILEFDRIAVGVGVHQERIR